MHKPKNNSSSHRSPLVDETVSDYHLYVGSDLQDRYPGTAMMDLAFGRSGNDRLLGLGMDDDLMGGSGNDRLDAGDGHDHLGGGAGNVWLVGGDMADLLMGGAGNEHLDEGAGHGDLNGGPGNDTLVGGLGADAFAISPDSGHDTIKDFVAGPGMFDHLAIKKRAVGGGSCVRGHGRRCAHQLEYDRGGGISSSGRRRQDGSRSGRFHVC